MPNKRLTSVECGCYWTEDAQGRTLSVHVVPADRCCMDRFPRGGLTELTNQLYLFSGDAVEDQRTEY